MLHFFLCDLYNSGVIIQAVVFAELERIWKGASSLMDSSDHGGPPPPFLEMSSHGPMKTILVFVV
jgi:hypothetical protein